MSRSAGKLLRLNGTASGPFNGRMPASPDSKYDVFVGPGDIALTGVPDRWPAKGCVLRVPKVVVLTYCAPAPMVSDNYGLAIQTFDYTQVPGGTEDPFITAARGICWIGCGEISDADIAAIATRSARQPVVPGNTVTLDHSWIVDQIGPNPWIAERDAVFAAFDDAAERLATLGRSDLFLDRRAKSIGQASLYRYSRTFRDEWLGNVVRPGPQPATTYAAFDSDANSGAGLADAPLAVPSETKPWLGTDFLHIVVGCPEFFLPSASAPIKTDYIGKAGGGLNINLSRSQGMIDGMAHYAVRQFDTGVRTNLPDPGAPPPLEETVSKEPLVYIQFPTQFTGNYQDVNMARSIINQMATPAGLDIEARAATLRTIGVDYERSGSAQTLTGESIASLIAEHFGFNPPA